MSALGQKQTFAPQQGMSALPPIAPAKADSRKRSCLLYRRKRTCAAQDCMSAKGHKRTSLSAGNYSFQIASAVSTTRLSLACSSASTEDCLQLRSQNRTADLWQDGRCRSSVLSSFETLLLMRPNTTPLFLRTARSGAKLPARGVSYSRRK